jgi:hypothetical protein
MSYARCVALFKTRQSRTVRFSSMPMLMKLPGLKPIEAQKARSSAACVLYLASMPLAIRRSNVSTHHRFHDLVLHVPELVDQNPHIFAVVDWNCNQV